MKNRNKIELTCYPDEMIALVTLASLWAAIKQIDGLHCGDYCRGKTKVSIFCCWEKSSQAHQKKSRSPLRSVYLTPETSSDVSERRTMSVTIICGDMGVEVPVLSSASLMIEPVEEGPKEQDWMELAYRNLSVVSVAMAPKEMDIESLRLEFPTQDWDRHKSDSSRRSTRLWIRWSTHPCVWTEEKSAKNDSFTKRSLA